MRVGKGSKWNIKHLILTIIYEIVRVNYWFYSDQKRSIFLSNRCQCNVHHHRFDAISRDEIAYVYSLAWNEIKQHYPKVSTKIYSYQIKVKHFRSIKTTAMIIYSLWLNDFFVRFSINLRNFCTVCIENGLLHKSNTYHRILAVFLIC